MPVVTVHTLPPADPAALDRLRARVPTRLSAALGQAPRTVWLHVVTSEVMAVGPEARPFDGHCPQVVVRARAGRAGAAIQAGLRATAEAVAEALAVPLEDVWVHWVEIQPGRVFAGGGVR